MVKEEFYTELEKILTSFSFTKKEDTYVKSQVFNVPGNTVIVNGQQMQGPSREVKRVTTIKVMGEGAVDDREILILNTSVEENSNAIFSMSDCFYFDEGLDNLRNYLGQF